MPRESVEAWRILLFEDNPADALVLRTTLDEVSDSHELVHVERLAEGLETLESNPTFDLILLDLSLPDSFGPETFLRVKEHVADLPVVILTGFDDGDLGARLVQMGAQDYMVKGELEGSVLLRALRHAIERQRIESELREARAAAVEGMRVKTEFLASMSHEIRTPMNSILGMADLLLESPLNDEQMRYVNVFRTAGETLLELINGILDLSKAESGSLELERRPFDLGALIEGTMEILAFPAHKKGLVLASQLAPEVPRHLSGDAARLRQVLINLVGNAIKFTDQGEILVRVLVEERTGEEVELRFEISDTGIGIAKEKLASIFERFSQADGSVTRRYGGTGLGLSLALEFARLMQGRMWVETEPGQGSTFYVTARCRMLAPEGGPGGGASPRGRALVADDSAVQRGVTRTYLEQAGYLVEEVERASEATARIQAALDADEPFDLIVLDCRMPETGGFQVLEAFDARAVWARTVMLLPSDHRPGDVSRCLELGLKGWLVLPLKESRLEEILGGDEDAGDGAATATSQDAPASGDEGRPTLRILVADDSIDNSSLVLAYFKDTPHQLDVAENGEVAFERFRTHPYDVVLMDMQMPVMDGYSATRAMRRWEQSEERPRTPILALTAHTFPEERRKCLEAGCDTHLAKPIRKHTLLEAVRHYGGAREPLLVSLDPDLGELVDGFLENRRADLESLTVALDAGDFDVLRVLAHNMKGAGRSYGFEGISEIGAALERAARNGHHDEAARSVEALRDYLARVEVDYSKPASPV